jgi:branched-chain amino acid transport system ATP-binding protein
MTALLHVAGVTVRFGGVVANDAVDLEIGEGELVGLIGPNGAGKTTCIDALTGFVPAGGRVHLAGTDLSSLPAVARARAGLVRTWQTVELFDDLSVGDNLAAAAHRAGRLDLLRDLVGRGAPPPRDEIDAALDRVGLRGTGHLFPGELPHGQRKLVGVARALVARPRLLCLDEPAAGLDEAESRALGRQLRDLADGGLTLLLVDHDMPLVFGVCDRVYVMDTGRVIASGGPEQVRADPAVIDAYLGTGHREGS